LRKFIFCLVACLIFVDLVFAHPPQKVEVFIVKKNIVDITVTHPSPNLKRHYVDKIEIILNRESVYTQKFTFQKSNFQKFAHRIPGLKKGDVLEVIAYCNRHGQLGKKITVE